MRSMEASKVLILGTGKTVGGLGKTVGGLRAQLQQQANITSLEIEQSRLATQKAIMEMKIEVRDYMQKIVADTAEREQKRFHDLEEKIASVPSKAMISEWARTATDGHLKDPSTFGVITTACHTATSSITASVDKGTTDIRIAIRNEKAQLMKDISHAQTRTMNEIANKINSTGAVQQIDDARQQAITEIASKPTDASKEAIKEMNDAAREIMVNIQAAAPFPGTTLSLPLDNVVGTLGRSNSTKAADNPDTAS